MMRPRLHWPRRDPATHWRLRHARAALETSKADAAGDDTLARDLDTIAARNAFAPRIAAAFRLREEGGQ